METALKAGLWRTNITPPLDSPLVGGVDPQSMQGILDELYARALVLDDRRQEAAVVSVDVLGIPYGVVRDIVAGIEECCGIPADHVTLSATHTHRGPPLYEGGEDIYTEAFKKLVVTAVYVAQSKVQPVRIGVGRGINGDCVFNRRLKKPDGSIVMNWTDIDYLQDCAGDGPVDPEMIVLQIETMENGPLGFVVNYANHNNAVPQSWISADISGYMARLLRKIYGDDVITLFLLGACGNVNWLNYRDRTRRRKPTLYQDIATSLTGTVLQILPHMEYPDIAEIGVNHQALSMSERPFEEYDTYEDLTYGVQEKSRRAFFDRMHRRAKRESEGKELAQYEVDLHAIRIGEDIAMATVPGELFVEYGLQIKAGSPFKYTIVAELTNGSVGYIPTEEAYQEGGYEVRKPANRLQKDAGPRMTEVSLGLLNELYSGLSDSSF